MKILVLTPRFPYPLDKGDKLRAFHQIRLLSEHHDIALFALSDRPVTAAHTAQLKPYVKALHVEPLHPLQILKSLLIALPSKYPFQVAYHTHPRALRNFRQFLEAFKPDIVYFQLLRTLAYIQEAKGYKLALDMMDPFAKNVHLRLPHTSFWLRPFLAEEEARLDYAERIAFERFGRVGIISPRDREDIRSPARAEAFIIPNGIDTTYYQPMETPKKWDVCFVGSMRYPSNIEAALFLAEQVMPRVWETLPQACLVLVGADPPRRIRRLRNSRIEVTGRVPDTRPYYAGSKVFCAPMYLNTGIQNKILEAMAMGLPVVTTSRANESLQGQPDAHLFVADDAEIMAHAVLKLLFDSDLCEHMGNLGRKFVLETFSWDKTAEALQAFFELA
ncbi:MAG: glycosyltransferase [Flavobacteriales bacterium]|nr:glycosyltransferase [Flavobacteriales bacterium]MCX7649216.1 glycosyltransferase [Flavobacteriales bacterium]MDW8431448.1 glycosyltransferase [Flavobacteriales bacterium]